VAVGAFVQNFAGTLLYGPYLLELLGQKSSFTISPWLQFWPNKFLLILLSDSEFASFLQVKPSLVGDGNFNIL
jgi:hypothetical protein